MADNPTVLDTVAPLGPVPTGDLSQMELLLRKLGAGALSSVGTFLPGMYSALNSGAQAVTGRDQEYLPGADAAGHLAQSIDQYIRDGLNVPVPATPVDRAVDITGSLFVPTPKVGALKYLAPILPGRQAETVAGTAAEVGLPYLLGETYLHNRDNTTPDALDPVMEAVHQLGSTQPIGNPQADQALSPQDVLQGQATPGVAPETQQLDSAAAGRPGVFTSPNSLNVLPPVQQSQGAGQPNIVYGNPISTTGGPAAPSDELSTTDRVARAVLGAAAVVGFGSVATRYIGHLAAQRQLEQVNNLSKYSGNITEAPNVQQVDSASVGTSNLTGPITKGATKLATQFWDNNAPLGAALNKAVEQGHLSAADAQALKDRNATISHAAMSSQINSFYKTGLFPGSSIKVDSPVSVLSKVQSMKPEEIAAWNDIRVLGTKLDTLKEAVSQAIQANKHPNYIKKVGTWGGEDIPTLEANLRNLKARFPQAAALSKQAQPIFNGALRYLHETGMIDAKTYAQIRKTNPNYHPLSRDIDRTNVNFFDNLFHDPLDVTGNKGSGITLDNLKYRLTALEEGRGLSPDEIGSPVYNMPKYLEDIIRYATYNKFRNDAADILGKVSVDWKGKRQSLIKISKNPPTDGSASIKVLRDGKARYLTSPDAGLFNKLRWQPVSYAPVFANLSKLVAANLTGPANPLFWMVKHPTYEAVAAAFAAPKGTALGPVTRMLNHLPGLRELLSVPVGAVEANLGALKHVHATMLYNASQTADTVLRNSKIMNAVLGKTNVDTLSRIMSDAYARTSLSLAESTGAMSAPRFSVGDREVLNALQAIPGFREAKGFNVSGALPFRMYMEAYHAVTNSAKLQFFAANTKRQLQWKKYPVTVMGRKGTISVPAYEPILSGAEKTHLGAQTRALTGDSSVIGGDASTGVGRLYQQGTSAILYYNQFLRSMGALGRAMKDDPLKFASGMTAVGLSTVAAWSYMASTPEGRQVINDMTPEQRGRGLPVFVDGKLHAFINWFPELHLMTAPLTEAVLGMLGVLPEHEFEGSQDVAKTFWLALTTDFLPDMIASPPLQLVANAMSRDIRGANTLESAPPRQNVYDKTMDPDQAAGPRDIAWMMAETLAASAMSYIVSPAVDAYQAMQLNDKAPAAFRKSTLDLLQGVPVNSIKYKADAKQLGPLNVMFDNKVKGSVANLTWRKTNDASAKMASILKIGNPTVKLGGVGNVFGPSMIDDPMNLIPNLRGTPFATVYAMTVPAKRQIDQKMLQYKALTNEMDKTERNPLIPAKDKLDRMNDLQEQRRQMNHDILTFIRQVEDGISKQMGEPFSYEGFDLSPYTGVQ